MNKLLYSTHQKWFYLTVILWLGLISCGFAAASSLKSSVDRDTLGVSETLTFTLTATDQLGASMPDFSSLTHSFSILSTQQVSQISVIQGKSQMQSSWILTLSPKTTGQLLIPAFQVGADTSEPISVNITEQSVAVETEKTTDENKKSLFINATITPDNPYIGSQATYTMQLFYKRNVQNAQLSPPSSPDAEFIQLGDDQNYRKTIDNEVYQVLERQYAVIPQQSGEITLEPAFLTGDMATENDDVFSGSFFTLPGQPVRITGKPMMLKVRPKPAAVDNTQWWLPAKKVTLSEQWSTPLSELKVGEPVTRTITIEAEGVMAEQLPDVAIPTFSTLQVYPDKPILETSKEGRTLKAKKIIKYALLPNQSGEINLPALEISWWNTQTDKAESVKLAAQKLTIAAAKNSAASNVAPISLSSPATPSSPAPSSTEKTTIQPKPDILWKILSIIFALLWVITLGLWLSTKRKNKLIVDTTLSDKENTKTTQRQLMEKLKQLCLSNDGQKAQQYLLQWAGLQWPDSPPHNLGDIEKKVIQARLKEALRQLDKQLYTGGNTYWDGKQFWEFFQSEFASKTALKNNDKSQALPSLHPSGD